MEDASQISPFVKGFRRNYLKGVSKKSIMDFMC